MRQGHEACDAKTGIDDIDADAIPRETGIDEQRGKPIMHRTADAYRVRQKANRSSLAHR